MHFASQLGTPHYQVSAANLASYLATISECIHMEQRTNSIHVLHLQPDRLDYLGPDLNVFNQLTPEMTAIAQRMPLLELATAVHGSSADKSRGNLFIDVGYSSDINTRRTKDHGGVATPQSLRRTEEDIFQLAMLAMTEMTDLAC